MEVKHTLVEVLEDYLLFYCNPGGVQLYLNSDSSLFPFADYPAWNNYQISTSNSLRYYKVGRNLN